LLTLYNCELVSKDIDVNQHESLFDFRLVLFGVSQFINNNLIFGKLCFHSSLKHLIKNKHSQISRTRPL